MSGGLDCLSEFIHVQLIIVVPFVVEDTSGLCREWAPANKSTTTYSYDDDEEDEEEEEDEYEDYEDEDEEEDY